MNTETTPHELPTLSAFMRAHREEILQRWSQAVREFPAADRISQPRLLDHLPSLLDELAEFVSTASAVSTMRDLPKVHALDRLDVGFDLKQVAHEYAILRDCVLRLYERTHGATALLDDVRRFNGALDHAVGDAVYFYAQQRERVLTALDRVGSSTIGTLPMQGLLDRLLTVFTETAAAADVAAIMLVDDDGKLHTRATLGLDEEIDRDFSLAIGEGFAGRIAAERRPLSLRDAANNPLVTSETVQEARLRALYGVPLLLEGRLIGIAHMGSRTAYEFSDDDKLLFRALASRATVIIYETMLREQAETERVAREVEKARAAAEQTFRRMVESVKDYAIFMLDPRGHVRTWNEGAERIKGYRADEIIGQHFSRFYPEEVARSGACDRALEIAVREGRFEDEGWRVRKDGSRFWASVIITPITDEHGRLGGFTKVTRDLSETRRREAALVAEQRRRVDAEQRFRLMVESVKDYAILMLDRDGVVRTWNRGAELIKGYRANEIIGQHFSRFYPDAVAQSGACDLELEIAAREGRFAEEGWRVRKSGELFWASVVITAITDENGQVRGFVKVTRDLTERKRHEEELTQEMSRRLAAEKTAHLAELFIAVLGHDLRNPLNAMLMAAGLVGRGATSDRERRASARILSSGQRMERMIATLLDFTRIRIGGGLLFDFKPTVLIDLCRNIASELSAAHSTNELRCDAVGDTCGTWDSDRLEQAVSNLAANAIEHGAVASPVTIHIDGSGSEWVVVSVHNSGVIDPQKLPTLFEPFKGHRRSAKSSGLGLGLYISHEIIRAHGGEVHVRSNEHEGTTFLITLPRHSHNNSSQ